MVTEKVHPPAWAINAWPYQGYADSRDLNGRIDLANAGTRPGNAFTCDGMDVIIPSVQRLLVASRVKGIPVV